MLLEKQDIEERLLRELKQNQKLILEHLNHSIEMENQVQVMYTIGQIADEKIKLVVGTGSTITIISKKLQEKISLPLKKDFKKQITIKVADSGLLKWLGFVDIPLRLRNRIFNIKAVVIEEFPYNLLLGNDFLSTEKAIIDFLKEMLEIQTVSVPIYVNKQDNQVILIERKIILARNKMILVAQVECEYIESEFLIFESSGNLEKTGKLLVARSLVSIIKGKLVSI